ncbi:MAG: 3-keto-5-aminohexanoate cleavage protein [Agathobacter sp.]
MGNNFTLDGYKDPLEYAQKVQRKGLGSLPPLIITCAITGGNAGKEINPNLPESAEEQAESAYEAYKAGASMVHIHRRDPKNPAVCTEDPELYKEVNALVREKCPDIIVNNTAICGRFRMPDGKMGPRLGGSIYAAPEVASVDISNYCALMKLPKRNPPLFGRDEDQIREMDYLMKYDDLEESLKLLKQYGVKPEFEMFDTGDVNYLHQMIAAGKVEGPHLVQMVFTPGANIGSPEYLLNTMYCMPKDTIMGAIAVGPQQYPLLTMAMIRGLHVRVGMEDNIYVEKGKLAESNGQLVEKIVRIAKELGREIATPAQAREMLGLGAPRKYK